MRPIRTMRQIWDSRAPRRVQPGVREALVRIPASLAGRPGRRVTPWIFRREPAPPRRTVRGRVQPLLEPKAGIRRGAADGEILALYSLPGVEEETIRVELFGDVLVLRARGRDARLGIPFEVLSEALLPRPPIEADVRYSLCEGILEVRIIPIRRPGPAEEP